MEPYKLGTWVDGGTRATLFVEGTGLDADLIIKVEEGDGFGREVSVRIPLASLVVKAESSMAWHKIENSLREEALAILEVRSQVRRGLGAGDAPPHDREAGDGDEEKEKGKEKEKEKERDEGEKDKEKDGEWVSQGRGGGS